MRAESPKARAGAAAVKVGCSSVQRALLQRIGCAAGGWLMHAESPKARAGAAAVKCECMAHALRTALVLGRLQHCSLCSAQPILRALCRTHVSQVWCVPVPKPGSHVPAVCKPAEIEQKLQLLLALQVCCRHNAGA